PGALPFGASARLVKEEESGNPPGGMAADGGQVYLSGVPGALPFGASARLVKEEESGNPPGGMAADGGQVY
ncbi:hypothetical protein G7B21_29390, partial [Klebsiella pneumoniae]|nr:hypothetical protein [Klebsiella pneumoniae]